MFNKAYENINPLNERRLVQQDTGSALIVSVDDSGGADYTSIQAAIDDNVAYIMDRAVRINISAGTYNEHVEVPGYLHRPNGDLGVETGATLRISGSGTGNTNVSSITCAGLSGVANPIVEDIHFTDQSPWVDEQAALVFQGTGAGTVDNVSFSQIGGASRDHGIVYYTTQGGKVTGADFANTNSGGIRVKRGGFVSIVSPVARNVILCKLSHGFARAHSTGSFRTAGGTLFSVNGGVGFDFDRDRAYFKGYYVDSTGVTPN